MAKTLQPGIELQPDSATGYKVFLDGQFIGRVERSTRERNKWYRYAANGGFGSSATRRAAIDALIELEVGTAG